MLVVFVDAKALLVTAALMLVLILAAIFAVYLLERRDRRQEAAEAEQAPSVSLPDATVDLGTLLAGAGAETAPMLARVEPVSFDEDPDTSLLKLPTAPGEQAVIRRPPRSHRAGAARERRP